jgi:hypothetical protein
MIYAVLLSKYVVPIAGFFRSDHDPPAMFADLYPA